MRQVRDDEGATAVEYGIIAGVIGVVLIAAGPALAGAMTALLDAVVTAILG